MATGNFNGDGALDLVVANGGAATVSLFLGTCEGTFQPRVELDTGAEPHSIATGDFNRDGRLDLAVTSPGKTPSPSSSALATAPSRPRPRGRWPGRLAHWWPRTSAGMGCSTWWWGAPRRPPSASCWDAATGPSSRAAVGDLNADGKADLVIIDWHDTFSVHLGNGDGNLDLAVTSTIGSVSVLLGKGDGTFQPTVDYQGGLSPGGLAAADLDGDGTLDLAVADVWGNSINVLRGNGDGTFSPPLAYAGGWRPTSVLAGPFVAGQVPALLVVDVGGDDVSLLRLCR